MPNSVFVLGGGRMGEVVARDLCRSNVVDEVIIGDADISKAEHAKGTIGSTKIKLVKVDATDQAGLAKKIKASRVLINAVWYEHNLAVMKAAIQAKVHYNDLGGLFHMTRKQMELNHAVESAGITAVLGGGDSPGITNVMVALCAKKLDSVQKIRIRVGGIERGGGSAEDRLVFPFAVSTVFDEYSKTPVMYADSRFQEVVPLSGDEIVEFKEPVGRNICHYAIHSEVATLPLNFKQVTNVDFKLGVSPKLFNAIRPMIEAGLGDTVPIEVKGTKVAPRDFAVAYLHSRSSNEEPERCVALKTEVEGIKDGRRGIVICDVVGKPDPVFGVKNATALLTGVGASIVAQMIMTGAITKRGVVAPESCVPPERMFSELEKRNIETSITVT
jgi:saccharopine dehydrogenase-like NADP-dependent oxidoreductase